MDFGSIVTVLRDCRSRQEWPRIVSLCQQVNLETIENRLHLAQILDEYYMSLYYTQQYDRCVDVVSHFRRCHLDDRILKNIDFLLPHIRGNRRIVATFNVGRIPADDEIVICYGDFPAIFDSLIINNPIRRHLKYFWDLSHDIVESNPVWDPVDRIYIVNLDERMDRYIETLRELRRMGAPFAKVTRFSAIKYSSDDSNLNGHIGCGQSHIAIVDEMIRKGYRHVLILEDDFCFDERIEQHLRDLKIFFDRKYDYDVCLFATSKYYRMEPYDDLLSLSYQECTTASGYLISREGAKRVLPLWREGLSKMLETKESHRYAIDRYWASLQKDKKFFFFTVKMGYQRPGYSNITKQTSFNMD